ncbi:MAG: DrmE family protein [Geobacteraceae bacterium]|nr:DrmE family protein [Geobacteraceae bacterium]
MNNPAWVNQAEDRLVVFPGSAFLNSTPEQLAKMGVPALNNDDQLLLGLSGRMLKDGHSLAISLPRPESSFFVKLLTYLLRVRIDTLNGYIVGSYFQPDTLQNKNDLIWFGRPRNIFNSLTKVQGINPWIVTKNSKSQQENIASHSALISGTPLAAFPSIHSDIFENLVTQTRPFAVVVDATPAGGRNDIKELWEALTIYFPGIPILIVSALGDVQTDQTLSRIPIHRWIHRLRDQQLWLQRSIPASKHTDAPWQHILVEVPDKVLDRHLSELYKTIHNFRKLISKEPLNIQNDTYRNAAKIQQIFSTLCCPLETREVFLARHSRRGLFAVRNVERQLEIINNASIRYGEVDSIRKSIHESLHGLFDLLLKGTSGKAQALELFVKEAVSSKKTTLILVADKYEEEAVIDFLHKKDIVLVDDKLVSVKPAGHLKSVQSLQPIYDQCFIFTRMWYQDMWWIGGVAKQVYWFCYPFESNWVGKRLTSWQQSYQRASAYQGSKSDMLLLAWPKLSFLTDQATENEEASVTTRILKECPGSYVISKPFTIEHDDESITWLTEILNAEEQFQDEEPNILAVENDADYARITVEEQLADIPWPVMKPVTILSDAGDKSEIITKKVADLTPGDQIIMLLGEDVHQEILLGLFEVFHAQENLSEVLRWVNFWGTLVDSASEKFPTAAKLQKALQQQGTTVTTTTVSNWLNKKVIGPEEVQSVKNMALAVGNTTLSRYAVSIHTAIKRIWTEHQRIGRDLRQALLSRAAGATSVKLGTMTLCMDDLDEILNIFTVHSIVLPGQEPIYPKSLSDLVPRIREELGSRVHLTARATRSMENSPYRNLDKAWSCFELIFSDLWKCCNGEISQTDAKESFRQIGIELKSKTSAVTQGLSTDYEVKYEGKNVDIGAHLCLGTAYDPAKTMRIHYHWDSDKSLVVIHHAGRHLAIRSS